MLHDHKTCKENNESSDTVGPGVRATDAVIQGRCNKFLRLPPLESDALRSHGALRRKMERDQIRAGLAFLTHLENTFPLDFNFETELNYFQMKVLLRMMKKCPPCFVEYGTVAQLQWGNLRQQSVAVRERLEDTLSSIKSPRGAGCDPSNATDDKLNRSLISITSSSKTLSSNQRQKAEALKTIHAYLSSQLKHSGNLVVTHVSERLYG
eukprot:PhF_6_TR25807/c0_g1_i2/m.36420